ncbi:O-antigen ligase family protein [Candidatus Gottesmanbacteria bacterium]|nr:O-antigen ligase family protein [Candidatus Gottesmanbacteria bacterium]
MIGFVLFFLLLGVSIVLGDGKQPTVEVLWAVGALVFLWLSNRKSSQRTPPLAVSIVWIVIVGLWMVRAVFSDSVAYSLSSFVRLVAAYGVYGFFFQFTTAEKLKKVSSALLVLAVSATAASVFLIVLPPIPAMPLMNVLYSTYGHGHLADLLLFILPIAVFAVLEKPNLRTQTVLVSLLVGFFLTFARGAWLLFALFVFLIFLRRPLKGSKALFLPTGAALALALGILFFLRGLSSTNLGRQLPSWLSRQTQKPPIVSDARLRYWKQAIEALGERPWFGSGPGTFYLQSRRLQEAPNSYSWFAHSFPLQTLVEVGVIGAVPLLLFVIGSVWFIYKKIPRTQSHGFIYQSFLWGVVLVLAQSLFDFNLDYLYLWLLLWATLGGLSGSVCKKENGGPLFWEIRPVFVGFLLLYYGSWVASRLLFATGDLRRAFLVAPHQRETALAFLSEQKTNRNALSPTEKNLITYFYQKDPDVLLASAPLVNTPLAIDRYTASFSLDPKPADALQQRRSYLEFLMQQNKPEKIALELRVLARATLPLPFAEQITNIPLYDPSLASSYRGDIVGLLFSTPKKQRAFSKVFYSLGLEAMNKNPAITKQLWKLALDISPQWSYFHIELASLEAYVFQKDAASSRVLHDCMRHLFPRDHCRRYLQSPLPRPGFFKKDILLIV